MASIVNTTVLKNSYHLSPRFIRQSHISASSVRSQFLEYFRDNDHVIVPSSSVKPPKNDPSLSFVNAGMNQFKPVFQNLKKPRHRRVANSQKCVRVGGKHNDLNVVGTDSTHLTMFEMLGSWSFGDYWKHEACSKAWRLITEGFGLDKRRLYVTYFGGFRELEPDLETRDIWRQLGVAEDRIIGLGMEDNFWEMGLTGPCGPCTEIHYNVGGHGGLERSTELWNIVFMQHNRDITGTLSPLAMGHVDTGMGLERLTAVLNNLYTEDNTPDIFRTDSFLSLTDHIAKVTGAPGYGSSYSPGSETDYGYRVMADHSRMLTVCIADGMFPEDDSKLRNVLRRAQTVGKHIFKCEDNLLKKLSYKVVESLGDHYPELAANHDRVLAVLDMEEDNYQRLLYQGTVYREKIRKEYPRLSLDDIDVFESVKYYESLKCLDREDVTNIDGRLGYKLYESHGMEESDISNLATIRKINFAPQEFQTYFAQQKIKSKYSTALFNDDENLGKLLETIPSTDDSHKYDYDEENGEYNFKDVNTTVAFLIQNGQVVESLSVGDKAVIVTTETNFYGEAGGQIGDRGVIQSSGGQFIVEDTQRQGEHVLHIGHVSHGAMVSGDNVTMVLDTDHRHGCMVNHTATHVLNSVLHQYIPLTTQRGSLVTADSFRFDFSVYNEEFREETIENIENDVLRVIQQGTAVNRSQCQDLLSSVDNLTVIPGENYPDSVTLIQVGGNNSEPCCGTHLTNTGHIRDFVIVNVKTVSKGVKSVKCITGSRATQARVLADQILAEVNDLAAEMTKIDENNCTQLSSRISDLSNKVAKQDLAFIAQQKAVSKLQELSNTVKSHKRFNSKEVGIELVRKAVTDQTDAPIFLSYLDLSGADKFNLTAALKLVPKEKPAMLLVKIGKELKGKAVVPSNLVSEDLTAKKLLGLVSQEVGGKVSAPRGQDEFVNCNLMGGRHAISEQELQELINRVSLYYESSVIKD